MSNSVAYFIFGSKVRDEKELRRLMEDEDFYYEDDPKAVGFHSTYTTHDNKIWFGAISGLVKNGFSEDQWPQDNDDPLYGRVYDAWNLLPKRVRETLPLPRQLILVFQD